MSRKGSLRDEHLDDARIVRSGEFKLDRRRAMDKLARFQLQDPHRYVLELVAAAVRAGATAIEIHNDADDFAIAWDGRHPTAPEIEALFDHIFRHGQDDESRMLQHLAQGIHGALGLDPRWIHLERPGLLLDLTDPLDVGTRAIPRTEGVRIHVRERFSLAVMREWITATVERRTLEQDAPWCPIPITINGKVMRRRLTGPPPGVRSEALGDGHVWLAERGPVHVIRDGVRVDTVELVHGDLALRGSVTADALKLNASRSKVVRDSAWQTLIRRLHARFRDLLLAELDADDSPWMVADVRVAAMVAMTVRKREMKALWKEPVFFDANERLWSADQLRRQKAVFTFEALGRMAPELDEPQLNLHQPPTPRQARIIAWLQAIGVKPTPRDGLFEDLFHGRLRRADLARRRHPFDHSRALCERQFERDGVRGSIGFGSGVLPQGEYGCRVELRVDGLPVETTSLVLPGPLSIRLEGAFKAGPRFQRVTRDPAYERAVELATQEARELMLELGRRFDHAPVARQALHLWIRRHAVRGADQVKTLDPALRGARIFPLHGGGHVDLDTLVEWLADGPFSMCRDTLVLPFSVERLLADTDDARETLRALFGKKSFKNVAGELEDRMARERRLAAPAEPARIGEYAVARAPVDLDGLRGEVGLLVEGGSEAGTSIRVLHQGVFLGEVVADTGFPHTRAVLDLEQVLHTRRLDGLVDPDGTATKLVAPLRPLLKTLVLQHVEAPDPDAVVQAWLEGALRCWNPLPVALQELPLFPTVSGRLESIASLAAQPPGPVEYLPSRPQDAPPDLLSVLVLDASRRRIVAAQGFGPRGKRALRDVSRRLEIRREAHARFEARPIEPLFPIDDVVAVRHLEAPELRVSVGLSVDRDREPALRVRFLYDARRVLVETLSFPIAAEAVVHGPRVLPDPLYQGVQGDTKALRAAVLQLAWEALDTWLDFPALPPLARLRLLDHLLRLDAPTGEQVATRDRLAAFPLLAGLDGRLVKVSDLGDEVVLVPPAATPRDTPDGRAWLRAGRDVRRLLEVLGVEVVEGRALLAEIETGEQRRSDLVREGLFPAGGAFSAAWRVDRDGAKHWLGLGVRSLTHPGRIEWLVEDRLLAVEAMDVGAPVVVRVSDPRVEADLGFTEPMAGQALEDARARCSALADDFLLACARFAHGSEPTDDGTFTRLLGERLLPTLVRYAAGRTLAPGWSELPLVETSTGERLAIPQIAAGSIRVVGPGVYGRPAQGAVLRGDTELVRALREHGPTQDYTLQLRKEEEAWRRREAEPVRPQPRRDVLVTLPLSGGREGFLSVDPNGATDLVLHVGWRRLCRIPHKGPVPLVGHVSDPDIVPDATWTGPEKGPALEALERFLEERSVTALGRLLDEVPPGRTRLWVGILRRAFKHRRDMPKPGGTGWRARLSALPLFATGDNKTLTAWDVVQLRHPPRWVTPSAATPSIDPKRPYLVVEARVMPLVIEFFGGANAKQDALEDHRIHRRRAQSRRAFELPDGRYWSQRRVEGERFRAVLALETDLDAPGRLHFRVEGVPLETREVDHPGLFGVIEVRKHDKAFTKARKDAARDRAIQDAYTELVRAAAAGIRESWFGRRRVVEILGSTHGAILEAWRSAPLLTAPGAPKTLDEARQADTVLLGPEAVADQVVVLDESGNRELLEAIGRAGVKVGLWHARRLAEQERQSAAARKQREAAAHNRAVKEVRKVFRQLVHGLDVPAKLGRELPFEEAPLALRTPALEGSERAVVLAAWWIGERALLRSGRTTHLPELALRVGERLARVEAS